MTEIVFGMCVRHSGMLGQTLEDSLTNGIGFTYRDARAAERTVAI